MRACLGLPAGARRDRQRRVGATARAKQPCFRADRREHVPAEQSSAHGNGVDSGRRVLMGGAINHGVTATGCGDPIADAQPIHRVYVDGFWMDRTEVTNAEFARFVHDTGYMTVAERTPVRRAASSAATSTRSCRSPMTTPWPTRGGRGNGYPRRRSSRSPRAAACRGDGEDPRRRPGARSRDRARAMLTTRCSLSRSRRESKPLHAEEG